MEKFKFTKFFKENLKTIMAIIITALLVGITTTFASYNYFAKDVAYKKNDGTEISVDNALNELYKISNKPLILVDKLYGSKNQSSNNGSVSLSKNLEKGAYYVEIVLSRCNANPAGNTTNQIGEWGTLSGADEKNIIVYSNYGKGKDSSLYANQTVVFYRIKINSEKVIYYNSGSGTDDMNVCMFIFQ